MSHARSGAFVRALRIVSLGAIDFGLLVDGAVIIVENAVRRLGEARRERGAPLDG